MPPAAKLLLLISFLIASIHDIRTRTIPDLTHVLIFAAGILHIAAGGISFADAFNGLFVMAIVVIILILTKNPLGGGDYKMMLALTFALGLYNALPAFIITFAIAGLWIAVGKSSKKLKGSDTIPLAPFFSVGFLLKLIIK